MQRRRRPPASVAVEQCLLCLAQLGGGRPHAAGEATAQSQPAHFDNISVQLATVRDTMQRAVAEQTVAGELDAALELMDQAVIQAHQMRGLGDMAPTFWWELLLIRAAIDACLNGTDINLLENDDLRPDAFPDVVPEDEWNRSRCAREGVRALRQRIEALRKGLPLREVCAEVRQPNLSMSGALIDQMLQALREMEQALSIESARDFDVAIRASRRLHILLLQFSELDPLLDWSGLFGAVDTCAENIMEVKADPDGPRVY